MKGIGVTEISRAACPVLTKGHQNLYWGDSLSAAGVSYLAADSREIEGCGVILGCSMLTTEGSSSSTCWGLIR